MINNRSVPANVILPHLPYSEVGAAIEWLTGNFGFVEHYRYGGDYDSPHGAQLRFGDAWVMLSAGFGGHFVLTLFVDDLDQQHERVRAAGVRIVEELNETIYGELQFGVLDLDGNKWLFAKHAKDVSPADWGATIAKG
jgi:uncharacterized glyoxalase superfamily protein PhnB